MAYSIEIKSTKGPVIYRFTMPNGHRGEFKVCPTAHALIKQKCAKKKIGTGQIGSMIASLLPEQKYIKLNEIKKALEKI